jgi:hypothetical protein
LFLVSTAQEALHRGAIAIAQNKTHVIDLDLSAYFDTVRHHLLLNKVALRVPDLTQLSHAQKDELIRMALTLAA